LCSILSFAPWGGTICRFLLLNDKLKERKLLVLHLKSLGYKLAVLVQDADWEELDNVCCSLGSLGLGLFILGFACGIVCDLLTF
jgi:hypothetical protein